MVHTALALLLSLAAGDPPAPDPHRQFDFWFGEWSVRNRHLQPDGSWIDGSVARARITPVCGGAAVLEEWVGPLRGAEMNGFSLRSWNAAEERWDLLLNWTSDGSGAFGRLTGRFRHGRGEFFTTTSGAERTRYTFSDALPATVRWDSAHTADGGVTWRTDWIMEFTRTRAADELGADVLFDEDWNVGEVSPHAEARALDPLVGEWRGRSVGTPEPLEGRLRARLINKDCLVAELFEWRVVGEEAWRSRFTVRGWVPPRSAWESWRLSTEDPTLRRGRSRWDAARLTTDWTAADGTRREEVLVLDDGGALVLEESTARPGTDPSVLVRFELVRAR